MWRQVECGTHKANVHCLPKNVAAGNIISVDLDLPSARRIGVQHPAQQCPMQCHLLSLGKLVTIAFLFPLFSCAADVVCKQATASGFEEISSGAGSLRSSHVKSTPLSAFEAVDDLLSRSDEAKSTRQIVRRPERENAQWNAAIDKLAGDCRNSSFTAGSKHKIGGLLQGVYETAFIARLIRGLMPG